MTLTLYSNFVNSAGERVRIALALKGIAYEYVSVREIGYKAYRKINPQGLMPTLTVNGRPIAQATAILEYLEETYPSPSLLPADPILRAQARGFAQHIVSEMHAVDVIRIRRFLHNRLDVDLQGLEAWQHHWFEVGFQALEAQLAARDQASAYCFGNQPGWADLHLVPQARKAIERFKIDMSPYPLLHGVYSAAADHPAFLAATPERQPDYAGSFKEPSLDKPEGMW